MVLELAKPVALLLCLLSLYALFHTAFLAPGSGATLLIPGPELHDRILESLLLFGLSAGISVISGLLFREAATPSHQSLSATLPMRLFYWATGIMLLLFVISWYLETYCIFYRSNQW
jgi:hypothetical protein